MMLPAPARAFKWGAPQAGPTVLAHLRSTGRRRRSASATVSSSIGCYRVMDFHPLASARPHRRSTWKGHNDLPRLAFLRLHGLSHGGTVGHRASVSRNVQSSLIRMLGWQRSAEGLESRWASSRDDAPPEKIHVALDVHGLRRMAVHHHAAPTSPFSTLRRT